MPACTCPPAECSHATTSFAWGEEGPECSKLQILLPPSWLSVSTDVVESTPRPPAPASVTSEIAPKGQNRGKQWDVDTAKRGRRGHTCL